MFPLHLRWPWKNFLDQIKKVLDLVIPKVYKFLHLALKFISSAGLAQLVEQRFCKPQVVGSNPIASSIILLYGDIVVLRLGRGSRVAKGIRL